MRVQARTAAALTVATAVLCAVLVAIIQLVIVDSFVTIEEQLYRRNVERVRNAVATDLDMLDKKVVDWGQWDATYEFVVNREQSYIDENLNYLTLAGLGFRDAYYFNSKHEVAYAVRVALGNDSVINAPYDTVEFFSSFVKQREVDPTAPSHGLVQIHGELLLFSFTDILPSKRNDAPRGTLLVTSLVTGDTLRGWAHQTNLELNFVRIGTEALRPDLLQTLDALKEGKEYVATVRQEDMTEVFGLLKDNFGEPALLYYFRDARNVFRSAISVRDAAVVCVAISALASLGMLWWLINSQVLSRLSSLTASMAEIAAKRDTELRVSDSGKYRRSLKMRTLLTVALCFIVMSTALGALIDSTMVTALDEIEFRSVKENVVRAERALENRAEQLKGKVADWAQWDASYDFIQQKDAEYIESNLNYETLSAMRMKMVAYFNVEGQLQYGLEVRPELGQMQPLSVEMTQALVAGMPVIMKGWDTDLSAGFLKMGDELVLAARSPILDSERSKPSRGSFIFVRAVDHALNQELSKQTELTMSVTTDLLRGNGTHIYPLSEQSIIGQVPLVGLDSRAVGSITVNLPRAVYLQGLTTRHMLPWCLAGTGFIATFLAVMAVNRIILTALGRTAGQVVDIATTGDSSQRVTAARRDELGVLADQINSMLEALDNTQKELLVARDRAEAADRAKSTFIAKVSHELRTPIHSVTGMLRILLKEEKSKAKQSYIMMAMESAYGLLETINEILDFSKAEAGKLSLERIEFSLRKVVRESLKTIGPRVEEKGGLELVCDVDSKMPDQLIGDPLRLKQCFVNLLGNSTKFTKEGFIRLEVRAESVSAGRAEAVFEVRDSGVGIPQDRLLKIFEPFTQADDSVARVYTGTGLGLTIVKQVIEEMGGAIDVTSEPGHGTTFTMRVPFDTVGDAWEEPKVNLRTSQVAIIGDSMEGEKVLISGMSRYGLEGVMVPYTPTSLSSFRFELEKYGLVIISNEALQSPGGFGLAVELAASGEVPVVVLLSPSEISMRERLYALSVPHLLMRPVTLEDVLLTVEGRLSSSSHSDDDTNVRELASTRKLRILVADDARTNRIILTEMLEEAGHEVVCVENGVELLTMLEPIAKCVPGSSTFDLVLTDVQMPVMDGVTATMRLREMEQAGGGNVHVPMIAVTAHAMADEQERMRVSGVDDVVTKPIAPADLARVIKRFGGSDASSGSVSGAEESSTPRAIESKEQLVELVARVWRQVVNDEAAKEVMGDESSIENVLDAADLYYRSGDSMRRSKLIYDAFLQSFPDQLSLLAKATAENDSVEAGSAAHALKGLLLDIGAKVTGGLASKIETMCKEGDAEGAFALVQSLTHQTLTVARVVERVSSNIVVPPKKKPSSDRSAPLSV